MTKILIFNILCFIAILWSAYLGYRAWRREIERIDWKLLSTNERGSAVWWAYYRAGLHISGSVIGWLMIFFLFYENAPSHFPVEYRLIVEIFLVTTAVLGISGLIGRFMVSYWERHLQ